MKSQKIVFFSLTLLGVFSHNAQEASSSNQTRIVNFPGFLDNVLLVGRNDPMAEIFARLNQAEKDCIARERAKSEMEQMERKQKEAKKRKEPSQGISTLDSSSNSPVKTPNLEKTVSRFPSLADIPSSNPTHSLLADEDEYYEKTIEDIEEGITPFAFTLGSTLNNTSTTEAPDSLSTTKKEKKEKKTPQNVSTASTSTNPVTSSSSTSLSDTDTKKLRKDVAHGAMQVMELYANAAQEEKTQALKIVENIRRKNQTASSQELKGHMKIINNLKKQRAEQQQQAKLELERRTLLNEVLKSFDNVKAANIEMFVPEFDDVNPKEPMTLEKFIRKNSDHSTLITVQYLKDRQAEIKECLEYQSTRNNNVNN